MNLRGLSSCDNGSEPRFVPGQSKLPSKDAEGTVPEPDLQSEETWARTGTKTACWVPSEGILISTQGKLRSSTSAP